MSAKRTKKLAVPGEAPVRGRADLARLRGMTEAEINQTSPPDLADLPAGFWANAVLVRPGPKEAVSLRLDRDILEWFRKQGPRYQTRMNAVLRSYVTAMRERRPGTRRRASAVAPGKPHADSGRTAV